MSKIEYSYVAYTNTRDKGMEDKIMNVKLKVANNDN